MQNLLYKEVLIMPIDNAKKKIAWTKNKIKISSDTASRICQVSWIQNFK
jgi:hypothetical protein